MIFSFERQYKADNPWNKYVAGASWEYFSGMGFPDLIKSITKVDDLTVKFKLKRAEAPFLANLGMDFASILSKEYADKLAADGKMELMNQQPLGTGPFTFVAYQTGCRNPLQGQPGLLGRQGKDRRSRLRHHHRCRNPRAEAEGRRMPHHALSERRRRCRVEEGREPDGLWSRKA